jgi:transposase-like protein
MRFFLDREEPMHPPFCPNPTCPLHNPSHPGLRLGWFVHNGHHQTTVVGAVPRYRCTECRKTFSDRTFLLDYYTKKLLPYKELLRSLVSCESLTCIARRVKASVNSVENRLERLGRNCLAMEERMREGFHLKEDVVADGIENFDRSQYFPNAVNILVGKGSQYLYGYTHTTLRRKGRMREEQKGKREALERRYRAPAKGVEESFAELVRALPSMWDQGKKKVLKLHTDEHPAYPRAIGRVEELKEARKEGRLRHERYTSKAARTETNPLFSVNYYEREMRKDIAAYVRETTRFCRNVANGQLRFAVYEVWHNYVKPYRVRKKEYARTAHAEIAGFSRERMAVELREVVRRRAFISQLVIREDRRKVWLRELETPLKERAEVVAKYVAA